MAGSRDASLHTPWGAAALAAMPALLPGLRRRLILEGAGHWIQQERPEEVGAAPLEFLGGLPG